MTEIRRPEPHVPVFPYTGGWGTAAALTDAFAFPWPPCVLPAVNVKHASRDLLEFEITWRWHGIAAPAIFVSRRLVQRPAGSAIAFHDACFVTKTLPVPHGFATEMLRRCIPFYRASQIRTIAISAAVMDGRVVWPRFGFSVTAEHGEAVRTTVRNIVRRKLGRAYDTAVPSFGPDLLALGTPEGIPIGLMALMEVPSLSLFLDLEDRRAVRCLQKRGLIAP
ncbi:MAG TPA: hypothetical protein VGD01_18070 [Candidatus Elarobacter sp.]|jgi:hypothetical protein